MGKVIAETLSYPGLVQALRARRIELGLSLDALDFEAGLPSGYSAKIELGRDEQAARRDATRTLRRLGWKSLPSVLGALGLRLALVEAEADRVDQERAA